MPPRGPGRRCIATSLPLTRCGRRDRPGRGPWAPGDRRGRRHQGSDRDPDGGRGTRRAVALVEESAPWSPVTAANVRFAAAPLLSGWGGLGARADDARVVAVGLRGAAEVYSQADRDATAALRAGFIALGHRIGEAGPIAVLVVGGLLVRGAVTAGAAVLAARSLRYTPAPIGLLLRVLGSERAASTA